MSKITLYLIVLKHLNYDKPIKAQPSNIIYEIITNPSKFSKVFNRSG